jgi:MFS family permease
MTQADSSHPDGLHPDALHCPQCGYNLFGIDSAVCPECGLAIDRANLSVSRIPWSHRRQIGTVRAFLRTNWMAMFHTRQLADEVNRPVSIEDARSFRLICILLATLPLVCFAGWGLFQSQGFYPWQAIAGIAVVGVSIWLFLLAITGLPMHLFHPRSLPVLRQNRAIAIGHYTAAPLAWMSIPIASLAIASLVAPQGWAYAGSFFLLAFAAGWAILAFLLFLMASGYTMLLKRTTGSGPAKTWIVFFAQPVAWLVLGGVILAGIPLAALFVGIVFASLR